MSGGQLVKECLHRHHSVADHHIADNSRRWRGLTVKGQLLQQALGPWLSQQHRPARIPRNSQNPPEPNADLLKTLLRTPRFLADPPARFASLLFCWHCDVHVGGPHGETARVRLQVCLHLRAEQSGLGEASGSPAALPRLTRGFATPVPLACRPAPPAWRR